MPMLQPGQDPRTTLPNHRERGPATFAFSYRDIASLTGLSESRVRSAASQGEFDPEDLRSLFGFLFEALRTTEQKTLKKDIAAAKERAAAFLRR